MGSSLPALANENIVEFLAEGCELPFWVDDDDLDFTEELLGDTTEKPRLPLTRVSLDEQASTKQNVEVELDRL
jgi:hypothetical protein